LETVEPPDGSCYPRVSLIEAVLEAMGSPGKRCE
jgi:hypothetical protein